MMKIIFFGSDEFSVAVLQHLLQKNYNIVAVVTKPDQPAPRGKGLAPSPVKKFVDSLESQKMIFQPEKASCEKFVKKLQEQKADLFVVVSYGEILKQSVLDIPPLGVINVHPSLLPKYRGPSPVESVILLGEKETGVSIIQMSLAMDAGDILFQEKIPLDRRETKGTLYNKIYPVSNHLLEKVLDIFLADMTPPRYPQDHTKATFTKKFFPPDFQLSWKDSWLDLDARVRAFCPSPGAYVDLWIDGEKTRMKIFSLCKRNSLVEAPGKIMEFSKKNFVVAAKDATIEILLLQLPGKKMMSPTEFFNGFQKRHLSFVAG